MIINKTPHSVEIVNGDGVVILSIPSDGQPIRLATKTVAQSDIEGIPTSITEFGECIGLPEFQEGTWYIVSQLIKAAFPNRKDLLVPAEMVRNKDGKILGCKSLGR